MELKKLLIILLILLAIAILSLLIYDHSISGDVIKSSFTKAICDDKNSCQDYEIVCENNKIINQTPITGAAVQYDPRWKDPRTLEEKNITCS